MLRWPKHAAKGRVSLAEGLIAVTPVLVKSQRGAPDPDLYFARRCVSGRSIRRAGTSPRPPEVEAALRWLARASVPVSALEEASMVSRALDACGRKLDGSAAAPQYYRRRRRTFYAALKYAVREKRLSANPLDGAEDREWKAPEVDQAVDRRRVANPAQMRALLDAIRSTGRSQGRRLVALYGCMYYGMLRPSEAVALLLDECHLPAAGWGRLEFREVQSAAGREWTDDGEVHESRRPKGGPRNAVRRVPIPPALVELLCEHVGQYGTGPDGRLFWTYRNGIYQPSTLWQVLQKARAAALTPAQVASPVARKPYDFRHAGVSWRLNAGTPGPQVAEWAGHSVEVLYRIYAHCLDGDDERWHERNLANLPDLPARPQLLSPSATKIIPCIFRIMAVRAARRPLFQAGHIPSWGETWERAALPSIADVSHGCCGCCHRCCQAAAGALYWLSPSWPLYDRAARHADPGRQLDRGLRFQAMERYAISGGREGYERLRVLAASRRASTLELFRLAGLRPGMRCADLGCGSGDVTFEMAALAGPAGSAVGIDMDPVKLELARVAARGRAWSTLPSRRATSTGGRPRADTTSCTAGSCFSIWACRFTCCAGCGRRSVSGARWWSRTPTLKGCSATRIMTGSASTGASMPGSWPATAVTPAAPAGWPGTSARSGSAIRRCACCRESAPPGTPR